MIERENVIKALECRKKADKRCGNPCEDTGLCHYATAVRGLDGEIYKPFICDRERICADALSLLEDDETQLQYRNDHIAMYQAEIKRLERLIEEQQKRIEEIQQLRRNYGKFD